ncbi:MAG: Osmoregulated proline transporter OpuE [Verrucomicrobia subdivision 3 bacterium]|nr:Osmoregulated proline transporter OpuE [Limisphaerales bacterium]MCS1413962.1 Osmoregulated proline transporter OpuE [Limisphaerales bacterium]
MHVLDYLVLIGYFGVMLRIGRLAMRKVKKQEDYFLGGRSFGQIIQAFAAFGAGTGSSDPVNTARTSFTSGMSGIWSTMSWLFVTPFYWITAVWYRRMRHLTLGDWFVERYESRRMGAAYTVFGILFYMVYGSMLFSAIGKVAAPLLGDSVSMLGRDVALEYVLVPMVAVIVILYGAFGGLMAAYWTDVLQGICIIVLSVLLIPFGLYALVERFGDPTSQGLLDGFKIMHEQLPASMFTLIGSANASEFPSHRIVAVTVISLIGIVVQPHFIATGGGSAKSESSARMGLVAGNLAKRFCTIGWALTALIVLALFADNAEVISDPDKAWGIASRELLLPGLRGLMLACLLAALMSSVDCYMLVSSALLIRNLYVPFINPNASEAQCLNLARITGAVVVLGAVIFSWSMMNVFQQLQLTWIVPILFAAPFWVGMYWRRATTKAAWITTGFTAAVFFIIPWLLPTLAPSLKLHPRFTQATHLVTTAMSRESTPADVRRRQAEIAAWDAAIAQLQLSGTPAKRAASLAALGSRPEPLGPGDRMIEVRTTGGRAIYWSRGVLPVGDLQLREVSREVQGDMEIVVQAYAGPMSGQGNFNLDFLIYDLLGADMQRKPDSSLATMELPPKIIAPFLVMIVCSLITRRNSKGTLDRYYAKMKTPVERDPEADSRALAEAVKHPERLESKKLFPGTDLEFCRPSVKDVYGFLGTFVLCFLIIGLAVWIASVGAV